jgi:hypothetical protein
VSGFTSLFSDPCVHLSMVGQGWCVVSTHVDDLFVLFNVSGKVLRDKLWREVSSRVEVENLGPVSWALKTNILRDRVMGIIKISQEGYINDILQKYCVPDDSKTVSNDSNSLTQCVPTHQGTFIPECGEEDKVVDDKLKKKFQSQMGALWWLAGISRPYFLFRPPVSKTSEQTQQGLREVSEENL